MHRDLELALLLPAITTLHSCRSAMAMMRGYLTYCLDWWVKSSACGEGLKFIVHVFMLFPCLAEFRTTLNRIQTEVANRNSLNTDIGQGFSSQATQSVGISTVTHVTNAFSQACGKREQLDHGESQTRRKIGSRKSSEDSECISVDDAVDDADAISGGGRSEMTSIVDGKPQNRKRTRGAFEAGSDGVELLENGRHGDGRSWKGTCQKAITFLKGFVGVRNNSEGIIQIDDASPRASKDEVFVEASHSQSDPDEVIQKDEELRQVRGSRRENRTSLS